jgi:hypothetical protein
MKDVDKFDVFLCYNESDKSEVLQIAKKLNSFGINKWKDELEFRPGIPWRESLIETLGSIRSVAVFIGKDSDGPWEKKEIRSFLKECTFRAIPVIPVILKVAPHSPDLPIFLMDMSCVDFHHSKPDPLKQLAYGITGERDRSL